MSFRRIKMFSCMPVKCLLLFFYWYSQCLTFCFVFSLCTFPTFLLLFIPHWNKTFCPNNTLLLLSFSPSHFHLPSLLISSSITSLWTLPFSNNTTFYTTNASPPPPPHTPLSCRTSPHRLWACPTWRGSSTSSWGAWAWPCWWPWLSSATSHGPKPSAWRWTLAPPTVPAPPPAPRI